MGERTRVFNAFEVCCGNGSLDSLQTKSLYMGGICPPAQFCQYYGNLVHFG